MYLFLDFRTGRQKQERRYALKYYKRHKVGQSLKGEVTLDPACIAQECTREEQVLRHGNDIHASVQHLNPLVSHVFYTG